MANDKMLPVQHENLTFTIIMGTLISIPKAHVIDVEGCEIVLGLNWLLHNKLYVIAIFILILNNRDSITRSSMINWIIL